MTGLLKFVNDGPIVKHIYCDVRHEKNKAHLLEELREIAEKIESTKEEFRQYQRKTVSSLFFY